jgi:hypothetical protein
MSNAFISILIFLLIGFEASASSLSDAVISAGNLNLQVQSAVTPPSQSCHRRLNVVDVCLDNPRVPEGEWVPIYYESVFPCKGHVKDHNTVAFKARKNAGKIEISMNIFLNYKGQEENRAQVERRLQLVHDCVVDFYKQFAIYLKLDFTQDQYSADQKINVWDSIPRTDSKNWSMLESLNAQLTEKQACMITAHEIGHSLGLPDRYIGADCPDRTEEGPPDELMRANIRNGENIHLYQNDLSTILEPLCNR